MYKRIVLIVVGVIFICCTSAYSDELSDQDAFLYEWYEFIEERWEAVDSDPDIAIEELAAIDEYLDEYGDEIDIMSTLIDEVEAESSWYDQINSHIRYYNSMRDQVRELRAEILEIWEWNYLGSQANDLMDEILIQSDYYLALSNAGDYLGAIQAWDVVGAQLWALQQISDALDEIDPSENNVRDYLEFEWPIYYATADLARAALYGDHYGNDPWSAPSQVPYSQPATRNFEILMPTIQCDNTTEAAHDELFVLISGIDQVGNRIGPFTAVAPKEINDNRNKVWFWNNSVLYRGAVSGGSPAYFSIVFLEQDGGNYGLAVELAAAIACAVFSGNPEACVTTAGSVMDTLESFDQVQDLLDDSDDYIGTLNLKVYNNGGNLSWEWFAGDHAVVQNNGTFSLGGAGSSYTGTIGLN